MSSAATNMLKTAKAMAMAMKKKIHTKSYSVQHCKTKIATTKMIIH